MGIMEMMSRAGVSAVMIVGPALLLPFMYMCARSQSLFHDGDLAEPAVLTAIYGCAMAAAASKLLRAPLPPATVRSDS